MKSKEVESNIALYRKYRPKAFSDVIGQDHIVPGLQESLKSGTIAHAYLLCGPRGTGKTTIARIIASELGSSVNDIYEMDAASHRGIDDIREIRESVHTSPFDSKYKIYILDEVHMFTKDAWNALLKTIEEPPAHVIFILATTELEKVPDTIVSRCQTFMLKKPTDSMLATIVRTVSAQEGYALEEGGAELIALIADGAFRDALGTLQKVISFSSEKKVALSDIEKITGAPPSSLVNEFLIALAHKDIEKGYTVVEKVTSQNIDMAVYIKMILTKLRYALMLRYAPLKKKSIIQTITPEDMRFLEELIASKPEAISSTTLIVLLGTYQSLRTTIIPELPLELALIQIINGE